MAGLQICYEIYQGLNKVFCGSLRSSWGLKEGEHSLAERRSQLTKKGIRDDRQREISRREID